MKKIILTVLAMALAGSAVSSFAACAPKGNSSVTKIYLYNFDGGIGSEWLEADCEAFEKLMKDKSYETGKKGVKFEIDRAMNINAATMNTSGYNIYFDEVQTNVRRFASQDFLVDITDIVTTPLEEYGEQKSIIEKVDTTYLPTLKGVDGQYYGLPYYEWYPGIVYDIENFEAYGLYIAKPGATAIDVVDDYGVAVNFLKNGRDKENRSCGNDGVYGTEDDGLPTTLLEFLSLCKRMDLKNITPVQTSGMHPSYTNYFVAALWTSLAGFDAMRANYTFDKEITVVKRDVNGELMFTNEPLFTGLVGTGNDGKGKTVKGNYIMKPETETITLTEETGYRVYDMVERYYAASLLEIVQREGWFTEDSTTTSISHTDAQANFIFNGKRVGNTDKERMGMLFEGSYWYQESQRLGTFSDYYYLNDTDEKKLGWMSLPTSVNEPVAEGKGREMAVLEASHSYVTVNKASVKGKPGVLEACLDFMRFMYSDARLRSFTRITGIPKGGMYYELLTEDLNAMAPFQQSVWNLRDTCKVVLSGATNQTYLEKQQSIELGMNLGVFRPFVGVQYGDYASCLRWDTANKVNSQVLFDVTCLSSSEW